MREECKHFQSRTYKSGRSRASAFSVTRPISPGLSGDCVTYERRLADVAVPRSLVDRPIEKEPRRAPAWTSAGNCSIWPVRSSITSRPRCTTSGAKKLDEMERKQRGWKFWKR